MLSKVCIPSATLLKVFSISCCVLRDAMVHRVGVDWGRPLAWECGGGWTQGLCATKGRLVAQSIESEKSAVLDRKCSLRQGSSRNAVESNDCFAGRALRGRLGKAVRRRLRTVLTMTKARATAWFLYFLFLLHHNKPVHKIAITLFTLTCHRGGVLLLTIYSAEARSSAAEFVHSLAWQGSGISSRRKHEMSVKWLL